MAKIDKTSGALVLFKRAFLAGEKSDGAIQEALIHEAVWFHQHDHNPIGFSRIVEFMLGVNPEGHRCKAIKSWLEFVAKLNVSDKGTVTTRRRQEYDKAWLDGMKEVPWFLHAANIQQITIPTGNTMSLAGQLAKRSYLGEEPDFDKLLTSLKADYAKLTEKPTDKLIKWQEKVEKALRSGEIKRLDVVETPEVSHIVDPDSTPVKTAAA